VDEPSEVPGDGIDNDQDGFIDDVHGWNFYNGNNDVTDEIDTERGLQESHALWPHERHDGRRLRRQLHPAQSDPSGRQHR
jgi:hypothetical protein